MRVSSYQSNKNYLEISNINLIGETVIFKFSVCFKMLKWDLKL